MKNLRLFPFVATALLLGSASAHADAGARWTSMACDTVSSTQGASTAAERGLAAVLQAIALTRRGHGANRNGGSPQARSEHRDAAIAVAAFVVLESLYPAKRESLEWELAVAMSHIAETQAKADGAQLGRRLASDILRRLHW